VTGSLTASQAIGQLLADLIHEAQAAVWQLLYLQAGQRDEVATTLLDADQLAPEEVRCRHLTRQIITDLVCSYPRGTSPLSAITRLAREVGVTV